MTQYTRLTREICTLILFVSKATILRPLDTARCDLVCTTGTSRTICSKAGRFRFDSRVINSRNVILVVVEYRCSDHGHYRSGT